MYQEDDLIRLKTVGAIQLTNTIDQNSIASINFINTYKDPPVVVAYIKSQISD